MNLKQRVQRLEAETRSARIRWHRLSWEVSTPEDAAIRAYGADRIVLGDGIVMRVVVG